jgi:uncharacterized DUF497 family protein
MYDDVIYKGRFIWNRHKAEINRRDHRLAFEKATEVFDDPFFVEEYDEVNSVNEDRYNITGFMNGMYTTVSFTLRDNLTRIFSPEKQTVMKMKTLEDTLVKDEIVTKSGRVFRPGNQELLENIPADIVQEIAKRKWKEIEHYKESKK